MKRLSDPVAPRILAAVSTTLLVLATAWAYRDLRTHDFLLYDDNEYVSEHPVIRKGLTWQGVVYVFTQPHHATWHPLTGLSHMLDVSLFGLFAPAHLAVNVALHCANALLMFFVWRNLLGSIAAGFWIAAAFALHPLHVESVAWVAERKDVLSTFFSLIATWAFVRWLRSTQRRYYWLLVTAFTAALLSKPMAVTLPILLLLLDAWPLGRALPGGTPLARWWPLVREKAWLFALSFIVGSITIAAQWQRGAVEPLAASPLTFRLANAAVAYVAYLRDVIWPMGLSVFYPRASLSIAEVLLAVAILTSATAATWWWRNKAPWWWVGWAWYLVAIAPVSGILQVGDQARADRFTYLALTGIFAAIAWQVHSCVAGRRTLQLVAAMLAAAILATWAGLTSVQTQHWRNTETLFRHALSVTERNHVAHANLGAFLLRQGRTNEAIEHLQQALALRPNDPLARLNLGVVAANQGKWQEAIEHYRAILAVKPTHVSANFNLGLALLAIGERRAAQEHLATALREDPLHSKAWVALGNILLADGNLQGAVDAYRKALANDPDLLVAHASLAVALEQSGHTEEALEHYREVTRLAPNDPRAWFNLAAALHDAGHSAPARQAFAQALSAAERAGDPDVAARARAALATPP